MGFLIEQISIIHDISLDVKFLHEITSHLHVALSKLHLLRLSIELDTSASTAACDLEEIYTSVTLNRLCRELTYLCCCNCTAKSRLRRTCELYEHRSCERYLINNRSLCTLSLCILDALCSRNLCYDLLSLLVLENLSLYNLLDLLIIE